MKIKNLKYTFPFLLVLIMSAFVIGSLILIGPMEWIKNINISEQNEKLLVYLFVLVNVSVSIYISLKVNRYFDNKNRKKGTIIVTIISIFFALLLYGF